LRSERQPVLRLALYLQSMATPSAVSGIESTPYFSFIAC
jgi:hypothetical protein